MGSKGAIGILKLIVGEFSREDWGQMIEDKWHVSHLNGIANDGNPLNYILEPANINNSRKSCYSFINLAADPDKILCTKHQQQCFLAGARMCGRWYEIIAKMIEQNRQGRPAIDAFDSINYKKLK